VKTGEDRKINAERGDLWTLQQGQRRRFHSLTSDGTCWPPPRCHGKGGA
jgi:hypothetical protein